MKEPIDVAHLPRPPEGKTGWPWTEGSARDHAASRQWPLISIVTPSFNQGDFIEQTIRSVLLQGYPNIEYRVVDGGSTDGTVDVLRKYEPWLSSWSTGSDRGYGDALNKGFAPASGNLFAWINSSDYYLPGAFFAAARYFDDPGLDMIYGRDYTVDAEGRIKAHASVPHPDLKTAMLYARWAPLQDACFWRSAIHRRVGGLNGDLRYAADYDFFLRVAMTGRCVRVGDTFSAFRHHGDQLSSHVDGRGVRYHQERQNVWRGVIREFEVPWYRLAAGMAVHVPLYRYRMAGLRSVLALPSASTVKGIVGALAERVRRRES